MQTGLNDAMENASFSLAVLVRAISTINTRRRTTTIITGTATRMVAIRICTISSEQHRWRFLNSSIRPIHFSSRTDSLSRSTSNTSNSVWMVRCPVLAHIEFSLTHTYFRQRAVPIVYSRTYQVGCRSIYGDEYALSFLVILST